jgi:hypothetical protein
VTIQLKLVQKCNSFIQGEFITERPVSVAVVSLSTLIIDFDVQVHKLIIMAMIKYNWYGES